MDEAIPLHYRGIRYLVVVISTPIICVISFSSDENISGHTYILFYGTLRGEAAANSMGLKMPVRELSPTARCGPMSTSDRGCTANGEAQRMVCLKSASVLNDEPFHVLLIS